MKRLTASTFNTEVLNSNKLYVVMFTGKGCAPCAALKPVLRDIEKTYDSQVNFGEIDVGTESRIMNRYATYTLPTLLFFEAGIVVDFLRGMPGTDPKQVIEDLIKKILKRRK